MAAIAAYIDESWSEHEQVFVLACYLATTSVWDGYFTPRWRQMLNDAPRPISEFHASDCRQGRKEFSSWTREERNTLFEHAIGIVNGAPHTDMVGFASGIAIPGAATKGFVRYWQETAFTYSVLSVLHHVVNAYEVIVAPGERINIVLDEKRGFSHIMMKQWGHIRERMSPSLREKVGDDPSFGQSDKAIPLQAADLFAYETAREARDRLRSEPKGPSEWLKTLLHGRHHGADCIWYDDLRSRMLRAKHHGRMPVGANVLFQSGKPIRSRKHWPYGKQRKVVRTRDL